MISPTLILVLVSIPVIIVTSAAAIILYYMAGWWWYLRKSSSANPTLWDYEFVHHSKQDEWLSLRWNAFWRLQEADDTL